MKIFIGSSSEADRVAQAVFDLIDEKNEEGIKPYLWWSNELFPKNFTIIESLLKSSGEFDAAIFIFSEDDDVVVREVEHKATRDNVVFEYGLFSGKLDRPMLAIAKYKKPKMPSDLNGVSVINLKGLVDESRFKDKNRSEIHDWVNAVKVYGERGADAKEKEIIKDLHQLKAKRPAMADKIDVIIAGLSGAQDYMNDELVNDIGKILSRGCTGIYALDVIGPNGWTNSNAYKYLAPQLKRYLRSNITSSNKWDLLVSKEVKAAISRSIENALAQGMEQSETEFDDPKEFGCEASESYSLEFCRILLWSKRDLLTPVAESVIAIHEAFHVPLFFIEVADENSPLRNLDYILFRGKSMEGLDGLEGERSKNFKTKIVNEKKAARLMLEYMQLLGNNKIILAMDAREILLLETQKVATNA